MSDVTPSTKIVLGMLIVGQAGSVLNPCARWRFFGIRRPGEENTERLEAWWRSGGEIAAEVTLHTITGQLDRSLRQRDESLLASILAMRGVLLFARQRLNQKQTGRQAGR
ncbi:MAG: hypothetical protein ACREMA_20760, partial [Longimicrobiales bacterium]